MIFSVEDDGIGIEEEFLRTIFFFEPFTRETDRIQEDLFRGQDLERRSLKNLIDLMGGHIWTKTTPDMGSTFSIELNLRDTKWALTENSALGSEGNADLEIPPDALPIVAVSGYPEDDEPLPADVPVKPSAVRYTPLAGLHILVADDNSFNADIMKVLCWISRVLPVRSRLPARRQWICLHPLPAVILMRSLWISGCRIWTAMRQPNGIRHSRASGSCLYHDHRHHGQCVCGRCQNNSGIRYECSSRPSQWIWTPSVLCCKACSYRLAGYFSRLFCRAEDLLILLNLTLLSYGEASSGSTSSLSARIVGTRYTVFNIFPSRETLLNSVKFSPLI